MKTRCRKCSKIFDNKGVLGLNRCPECLAKGNEVIGVNKAQYVRNLVKDNPNISAGEVSSLTGLSTSEIIDYIKIEVLELSKDSQAYLKCEECGEEIKTGRYCRTCKSKYQNIVKMSAADRYRYGKMYEYTKYSRKHK